MKKVYQYAIQFQSIQTLNKFEVRRKNRFSFQNRQLKQIKFLTKIKVITEQYQSEVIQSNLDEQFSLQPFAWVRMFDQSTSGAQSIHYYTVLSEVSPPSVLHMGIKSQLELLWPLLKGWRKAVSFSQIFRMEFECCCIILYVYSSVPKFILYYFVVMDPSRASYARYWEPNMFQSVGLSLLAGSLATAVTYPIDYIKTVCQFRSEGIGLRGERWKPWTLGYNPFEILRQMHARGGGLMQFYDGFQAAFIGRLGYLVVRNSLYKIIYDSVKPIKPYNDLTNRQKMWISGFSGGVAALVTTPFTVVSTRQILDSQIKPEWRRNYGSVGSAVTALGDSKFKGAYINVLRHVLLNISLTAPYDWYQEALYIRFGDYGFVKPLSLFMAALTSSIITLPFDNVRTRIMNAQSDPSRNRLNYRGIFDVFVKSLTYEKSNFAMWAGFFSYFASTLIYASLTVGITTGITNQLKRANGVGEWYI